MGKLIQGLENASLRTGNTIATPLRRWGEIANAVANIPRQGISGTKNMAEVKKQTRDALVDNFKNFSKVQGKWYQKMLKVPVNLVSAVTRRPAMIAGAGIASGLNQWLREPFKKLLYTPGKIFKGIWNATRIFSKKKWFDFVKYDTHETWGDTRVNQMNEKNFGFFGVKWWSSTEKPAEEKKANDGKEEVPQGGKENPKEEKKPEEKKDNSSRWKTDSKRWWTWRWWTWRGNNKKEGEKIEEKKSDSTLWADKKSIDTNKTTSMDWSNWFTVLSWLEKTKPWDIIIAEKWVKWDSPIFRYNEKNKVYECVNYTDSYKGGVEKIKFEDLQSKYPWYPITEKDIKKSKELSWEPKNISDVKQKEKEKTEKKEADEKDQKFPKWSSLDDTFKAKYRKEYLTLLENKPTKEWVIARGKKAKMWDTPEDILKNFKEIDPTFVGYVEAEILNKAA